MLSTITLYCLCTCSMSLAVPAGGSKSTQNALHTVSSNCLSLELQDRHITYGSQVNGTLGLGKEEVKEKRAVPGVHVDLTRQRLESSGPGSISSLLPGRRYLPPWPLGVAKWLSSRQRNVSKTEMCHFRPISWKTSCEQCSAYFPLLANPAEAQDGKDPGLWVTAWRATTDLSISTSEIQIYIP